MSDEAYRMLHLSPEADGRMVETAYWSRARQLHAERGASPEAADELERLNLAYETLSRRMQQRLAAIRPAPRPRRQRQFALAGVAFVLLAGGALFGFGLREETYGAAVGGFERARDGIEAAIGWLQSPDGEPAPEAPPAASP